MKTFELNYKRELEEPIIIRFRADHMPTPGETWEMLARQEYNVKPEYERIMIVEIKSEVPTFEELMNR